MKKCNKEITIAGFVDANLDKQRAVTTSRYRAIKKSVHVMIAIQKVTSNVQSVRRQSI
jgi:hypothetical protein